MEKNKEKESTENASTVKNNFRLDYYTKMSHDEFEIFCNRLFTLHTTGIYTSPPPKARVCNKKKKLIRGPRKYIANAKKRLSTFGQGKIGTSCESYGVKNCLCCRPRNEQNLRILNNVRSLRLDTSEIYNHQKGIRSKLRNYDYFLDSEALYSDSDTEFQELDSNIYIDSYAKKNNSIICIDATLPSTSVNMSPIVIDEITLPDSDNEVNAPILELEKLRSASDTTNPVVIDEICLSDSDNEANALILELKKLRTASDMTNPNNLARRSKILLESMYKDFTTNLQDPCINNKITSSANLNDSDVILGTALENVPKLNEENTVNDKVPEDKRSLDCPICLEPIKNTEIMSTICGHIFCSFCIINCIRVNKKCPTCRKKLSLKSIHPIFV